MITNQKIIINFCPTGMVPDKDMTPHVPVSVQEIVEQTHEACELGITIAHLHARDENGVPTWKKTVYRDIFEGVRKHCPDLVLCGSTSGRTFSDFEKRSEVIELKPDMCSLTLSSLNFANEVSVNHPDSILKLASKMKEFGVNPELECFNLGMINYGKYLIDRGIITAPFYWNLLFGSIAGYQANFLQMGTALSELPDNHEIALAGLGDSQLPVAASAVAMGYGVRIGIEDNIWWDTKRKSLATNIELLKRVHHLIDIHGHQYMMPEEFGNKGFYNHDNG